MWATTSLQVLKDLLGATRPLVLLQSLSQRANGWQSYPPSSQCCCALKPRVPEPCFPELPTQLVWEQPGCHDWGTYVFHEIPMCSPAESCWSTPREMGNLIFRLNYLLGPTDCQSKCVCPSSGDLLLLSTEALGHSHSGCLFKARSFSVGC